MSTYVLMRILESTPRRYELAIRLLTFGHLIKAYDRLASHIQRGQQVLDIGCGTGALTLRAAQLGAKVKGTDINAEMLEIAEGRVHEARLAESVNLFEMSVAELDAEKAESYDVVMSGLCFSELSEDEVTHTLKEVVRILRPGGLVLIADEIKPQGLVKRLMRSLIRGPLTVLTYIIAQQTTHPISNLSKRLTDAGLVIVSVHLSPLEDFGEFVAQKPTESSP